jgi:hypothetical protein
MYNVLKQATDENLDLSLNNFIRCDVIPT